MVASTSSRIISEGSPAPRPVGESYRPIRRRTQTYDLTSKSFDSEQLLCVVFAGDHRLRERFKHPDLAPLGSRIRRRLHLHYAERDALTAALDHLLEAAGNGAMMTTELKATLAEHAAGNFRILMNLADDLMTIGYERQLPQLDEDLFLDVFHPPAKATRKKKPARRKR